MSGSHWGPPEAGHSHGQRRQAGRSESLKGILGRKGARLRRAMACTGARSAVDLALDLAGFRGRIALEGADTDEQVAVSPRSLISRSLSLIGINGWVTADFTLGLELLSSGKVDGKPLITHTIPLEEWETGFDLVTRRKSEAIKVEFAF